MIRVIRVENRLGVDLVGLQYGREVKDSSSWVHYWSTCLPIVKSEVRWGCLYKTYFIFRMLQNFRLGAGGRAGCS